MEAVEKPPVRSEAWIVVSSERPRSFCQRSSTERRIPRPCTVSPWERTASVNPSDWEEATLASSCSFLEKTWFIQVRQTSSRPPAMAMQPRIQWNMKIAARNTGVQGMSKTAKGAGPDISRWIDSRSRRPVAGRARSTGETERRRIASNTRLSSRAWKRAPARASTRPRA